MKQILNPKRAQDFAGLDNNKDGWITEDEFGINSRLAGEDEILTAKERKDAAMHNVRYFARRHIDKWFKQDRDRNLETSKVEEIAWNERQKDSRTLIGELSNEELSKRYNIPLVEKGEETIESWIERWQKSTIESNENRYGIKLTEKEKEEFIAEAIKQLNTWLLKEGDNENSSGYEQLSDDAYTRLGSTEDGVACCGGDICEYAGFRLNNLNDKGYYTADEMKKRLKWASETKVPPKSGRGDVAATTELGNFGVTPTFSAPFSQRLMTDNQIKNYKKIVETVTGQPWDSDGWTVDSTQFVEIAERNNGTFGDETRLQGKTRSDIPESRQDLLKALEERGWLYEQFEE